MAFPAEQDSRFLLARLYGDDSINGGRSLDHNLVMRVVVRNSGIQADGTTDTTTNLALVQVHFAKFPSPAALYDKVWGLIPDFLKAKIAQWATENKDGDIAEAITEFVKTALGMLPIPVPSFFLNGVVNLVVPPLVQLIITKLTSSDEETATAAKAQGIATAAAIHGKFRSSKPNGHWPTVHGVVYASTPNTHYIMRDLDRKILLSVGLPAEHLPAHLKLSPQVRTGASVNVEMRPQVRAADSGDAGDDAASSTGSTSTEEDPLTASALASGGQPDNNEAALGLKHFYTGEATNGCKPLHLAQIMAAQGRTNSACDGNPDQFGVAVWKQIKKDDKDNSTDNATTITNMAKEDPPDKAGIADLIYSTVHDLLKKSPYYVPDPILDSFTAMKVPEAVEYLVSTLG